MIRLDILGGYQCRTEDGVPLDLPLAKDRGLLAILALSPDYTCSRAKISNLLWSTRSEEQARASLRQSLWTVKNAFRQLGDDVIEADRKRVALDPSRISTDVEELRKLAVSDTVESLEQAVSLYGGDVLDGLVIRDPAWEEWLILEQENLRTLVIAALRKLVDCYAATSDSGKIMDAGRRLVSIDPLQEEGHRALIRGYAESGQRALALKQYERCRKLLRQELDTSPDPQTQKLYAEVRENAIAGARMGGSEGKDSRATPGQGRKTDSSAELLAVLERLPSTAPETAMPSILVFPFANLSGDETQDYLARGITDNIIISLTAFRELFVFAYKTSMAIANGAGDTRGVAARLGARFAVEGSVQKIGSRLRVMAGLVDVRDGHNLWADRYDRDMSDLLNVQDEIVDMVTNALVEMVEEADYRRAQHKAPQNLDAYDHVLRGRVLLNRYTRDGELEARRNFREAIDLDPAYAPAYAGLAVSQIHEYEAPWCRHPDRTLLATFEWARKALELDDLNIMGRYALAGAYFYGGEFELANLEIEKAVAINPHDYHNVCSKAWFMTFSGHLQEGLSCSIDAMRTNPYSADGCLETIGLGQYLSKEYEHALLAYGSTRADSLFKLSGLAACYAQLGRRPEAQRAARDFMAAADQTDPAGSDMSGGYWRSYWRRMYRFKNPGDREHYFDGLRKAGVPVDGDVQ